MSTPETSAPAGAPDPAGADPTKQLRAGGVVEWDLNGMPPACPPDWSVFRDVDGYVWIVDGSTNWADTRSPVITCVAAPDDCDVEGETYWPNPVEVGGVEMWLTFPVTLLAVGGAA